MTENLWMLAMLGMFGLFLWSLQTEARRSLKAIARDEDDKTWRTEMHVALAQRNARQRLAKMRAEEAKRETARRIKAEREAYRAAHARRARWQYEAPCRNRDDLDISGEAFGDHGFAHIAAVIDEDELYVPLRSFNERVGRLGGRVEGDNEFPKSTSRLAELQEV